MARSTTKKNKKATTPTLQEELDRGIAAAERGDREEAHRIFQQTIELHPEEAGAWVWLGGTTGDLDEAEAAFEKASSLDPENDQASLGLRWVRLRRDAQVAPVVGAPVSALDPGWAEQVYPAPAEAAATPAPITQADAEVPTSLACPNCGKENDLNQKFCVDCGQDLQAARTPVAPAQSTRRGIPTPALAAIVIIVLAIVAAGLYWYFGGFK